MKLFVVFLLLALFYFLFKGRSKAKSDIPTPPPTPAPTRNKSDEDTWEGSFWETENQVSVSCSLRIEYSDRDGKETIRDIDVRKMGDYGPDKLIMAHCRLRDATRTFLLSRIKKCVDLSSGEVVEPLVHLQMLYRNSPDYVIDTLHRHHLDFVKVLIYAAKADGAIRKKERQIIVAACNELVGSSLLDEESFSALVKSIEVPSLQAFKNAINRIAKGAGREKELLVSAITQMVESEKTVSAGEREALDYVKAKLAI